MKAEGYLNQVTEDEIEKAKEANQGLKLCIIEAELDEGIAFEALLREPNNAVVRRFIAANNGIKGDGVAHHDQFVTDCIISPSKEEYFEMLQERPALSLTLSPRLIEGHGLSNDSKKKSL